MDPNKSPATRPGEGSGAKKRILVVDDEAGIRKVLCGTLNLEGYDCRGCDNAIRALELISSESFDAIICDYRMPGADGLELLRMVRRGHPHLAFIMATATDDARVGVEAMKEGADDYLVKPLNLDAMVSALDYAMEQRHMEIQEANHHDNLENTVDELTKQLQAALRRVELIDADTLQALAAALDLRDNETVGHSRRVIAYSLEIARAGLRPGTTEDHRTRRPFA